MARVNDLDNVIKAKILKNNCPINASVIDENETINGTIIDDIVPATTETKGIIRIATNEEAIEGTSQNTAITPSTLRLVTHYVHEQGIASKVWVINHNLNKRPSITVVDTADEEQIPEKKEYNNNNTVTLYFLAEFKGKAILN